MPTFHKIKTVFVHIPKTAGTSIVDTLYDINGHDTSEYFDKHESVSDIMSYLNWIKFYDYTKFTVVRNPYDRLVSWFHYYRSFWLNREHGERPCSEKCISEFMKGNFNDWVAKLKPYHDSTCQTDVACPFHIISPQYRYLIDSHERIMLDFIIRYENLNEDWGLVSRALKIEHRNLPVSNKTEHKHYSEYYNESSISKVERIYKKDLDLFKYSFKGV